MSPQPIMQNTLFYGDNLRYGFCNVILLRNKYVVEGNAWQYQISRASCSPC